MGMISSPVAAYFVVVVYMTRFSLEKKHRRVTVEYAGTKEQELQEQLSLQAMQIKKKDARIAYFEKNRSGDWRADPSRTGGEAGCARGRKERVPMSCRAQGAVGCLCDLISTRDVYTL